MAGLHNTQGLINSFGGTRSREPRVRRIKGAGSKETVGLEIRILECKEEKKRVERLIQKDRKIKKAKMRD